MAREHREWLSREDIRPVPVPSGPLRGAARCILSEDDETGAMTALVEAADGWSGAPGALAGLVELFVVRGELELGGTALGHLGYAELADGAEVTASAPSAVLLLVDPARADNAPSETLVVEGEGLPWEKELHGAPAGVGVKVIRSGTDGEPVTLLVGNVPRYDSGPEFHECPEEIFVLEGDVGNDTVSVRAGDYLWRPAYITHGPYRSETGLLVFLRGHGELTAHWIDDPSATVEQNRAYAARLRAGR